MSIRNSVTKKNDYDNYYGLERENFKVMGLRTGDPTKGDPHHEIKNTYMAKINSLVEKHMKQLSELVKDNEELMNKTRELEKQHQAVTKTIENKQSECSDIENSLKQKTAEFENYKREINTMQDNFKTLEDNYEKTIYTLELKLSDINAKIQNYEMVKNSLSNEISQINEEKRQLEANIVNYESEISKLSDINEDQKKKISSLQSELEDVRSKGVTDTDMMIKYNALQIELDNVQNYITEKNSLLKFLDINIKKLAEDSTKIYDNYIIKRDRYRDGTTVTTGKEGFKKAIREELYPIKKRIREDKERKEQERIRLEAIERKALGNFGATTQGRPQSQSQAREQESPSAQTQAQDQNRSRNLEITTSENNDQMSDTSSAKPGFLARFNPWAART